MNELLGQRGFAFIRRHAPELETTAALASIGRLVRLDGFAETQVLKPVQTIRSTPNTYSGNYGLAAFPLHTDRSIAGIWTLSYC